MISPGIAHALASNIQLIFATAASSVARHGANRESRHRHV
jgi:hypothetical protein